jgi:hypothetical protein
MWTSTMNDRLAMMLGGSCRRRSSLGRWRRGTPLERTARTAATVAAPATRPPAAAIAAVLTSPRQASTSVRRDGSGSRLGSSSSSASPAVGSSTAWASSTASSRMDGSL